MSPYELRRTRRKLGLPVFLLANLCLVETWDVEAWEDGRSPIPDSVEALLSRMHRVPRSGSRFRKRERS